LEFISRFAAASRRYTGAVLFIRGELEPESNIRRFGPAWQQMFSSVPLFATFAVIKKKLTD